MLAVVVTTGLALASTLVLLLHARQKYATSVANAQERQGENTATMARLREDVSLLKAKVLSASTRNDLLLDENVRHRTDSQSMHETIKKLSEIIQLAKLRLSESRATITKHAADITQLNSEIAELRRLLSKVFEERNGLHDRVMGLELTIHARDEQIASLTEVGTSHSKEVAQLIEDKDRRIKDLQDRVSECHSQLLVKQQLFSLGRMVFKHGHRPSRPRSEPSRRASLGPSEYRNNPWDLP